MILIGRYLEDRSTTSITYKHYNTKPEDKYPTYSICFTGSSFYWRDEFAIFDANNLYSYQLEQMLRGRPTFSYQYDGTGIQYKILPLLVSNDSKIEFYHVHLKDILVEAHFTAYDSKYSKLYRNVTANNLLKDKPFYIDYQTHDRICFTRDSKYVENAVRKEDVVAFKKTMQYESNLLRYKNITYQNTFIEIYIHYPGQLIQALDTPSFVSSFLAYRWDEVLELKLSQGTILRKRSDSVAQCDDDIVDYDLNIQESVCKKNDIRCIPPFWKKRLQRSLALEACTSPRQLKRIYCYTRDYKDLLSNLTSPCVEMYNSIVWNWNARQENMESSQTVIKFLYLDKYYEEIQYLKEFDVEGLISNLGGFVGIFLGYSFMQLPELLGRINIWSL